MITVSYSMGKFWVHLADGTLWAMVNSYTEARQEAERACKKYPGVIEEHAETYPFMIWLEN